MEDVLEDVLVENAEEFGRQHDDEELNNGSVSTQTNSSSETTDVHVHSNPGRAPNSPPSLSVERANRLSSVIMMYSPYIPSIDEQRGTTTANSSRSIDVGNYYARIDTEETVKCFVTSVLFCAVIALIILVAVLKNPGM